MAGMYSAKVMEHFAHPHNVGELPDANGVGEVGNPKCGDIMRIHLIRFHHVYQNINVLIKAVLIYSKPYSHLF